ncbi:MAG: hypothetical protein WCD18_20545, partial [Thermosynechococcaceae cyanobacterium]
AKLGFPQTLWQTVVQTYTPALKTGDPALFLSMAQGLNAKGGAAQTLSPYNIDIERTVPYRK